MRRLDVEGDAEAYSLVLRSFVKPFYVKHALGPLRREADILQLLAGTHVPAARLHGVDAAADHCDHPSRKSASRRPSTSTAEAPADRAHHEAGADARQEPTCSGHHLQLLFPHARLSLVARR